MKMEIADTTHKYPSRLSVYLPSELHAELHKAAHQKMMSGNAWLRQAIAERLKAERRAKAA